MVPEKGPDFYSMSKMLEILLSPHESQYIVSWLLANMVQVKLLILLKDFIGAIWAKEQQRGYTLHKYPHFTTPKKRIIDDELSITRSGSTILLSMFNLINSSFNLRAEILELLTSAERTRVGQCISFDSVVTCLLFVCFQ
jgi:hypothetical protein